MELDHDHVQKKRRNRTQTFTVSNIIKIACVKTPKKVKYICRVDEATVLIRVRYIARFMRWTDGLPKGKKE